MKKFVFLLPLFVIALICSQCKKDREENPQPVVKPPNKPPASFSVEVTDIGITRAVVRWSKIADPDNDVVDLEVFLGTDLAFGEMTSDSSFTLTDLKGLHTYEGYVRATDRKTDPVIVPFSFKTKSAITVFSKLFPALGGGDDIILDKDGGFVTTLPLNKYDSLGNVVFDSRISPPGYGPQYTDLIQSADGGYVLTNRFEIQKFDIDGNFLWKNEWLADTLDYSIVYNAIAELPEGGYLAVGNSVTYGGILQKFDEVGKRVWFKHFDLTASETMINCTSIKKTNDGNLIIVGSSGTVELEKLAISRIDPEGNIQWIKNYSIGNYVADAEVTVASDGSFIIGCKTMNQSDDSYVAWVMRVGEDGDKIWDKTFFFDGDDTELNAIIQMASGEFVFVGSTSYYQKSALLVKLSPSGELIWKRKYAPDSAGAIDFVWIFFGIQQTHDGGFIIMGGKGYIYEGEERGLWILKTDDEGNF